MTAAYQALDCSIADGVLTITLQRPQVLNALNESMIEEFLDSLAVADGDPDVRAVIVTGSGRAFCAGADLSGGTDTFATVNRNPQDPVEDLGGETALRLLAMRKPVIAAINGPAVGLGVTMTLPMDIRLASTTAKFGFVQTRRGIVAEAASAWFLPRIVGPSRAAEWLYSGRVFDATEACSHGLVRNLCPPDELLGAATELAHELIDQTSPTSVAATRQLLWRGMTMATPLEAHVATSWAMHLLGRAPDAQEGVASFLEKRPARFSQEVTVDLAEIFDGPAPEWAAPMTQPRNSRLL